MEKINIVELLKDCPKGMELYSPIFEGLEFDHIDENGGAYPIICRVKTEFGSYNVHTFTKHGCYSTEIYSKCSIFPKGKNTWEGFHRPFKDGDIIITGEGRVNECVAIFKSDRVYEGNNGFNYHSLLYLHTTKKVFKKDNWATYINVRFATEEEKQKLFQAIKDNGYKWNPETKTLEKLIEPKFKAGDRIRHKENTRWTCTIARVEDRYYVDGHPTCFTLPFGKQNEYELFPQKFDISSLIPFESRVLVRNSCDGFWMPTFWGICEVEKTNRHLYRNYLTTKGFFLHCIPYNDDTKHLLGTQDDCDEYYKNWK